MYLEVVEVEVGLIVSFKVLDREKESLEVKVLNFFIEILLCLLDTGVLLFVDFRRGIRLGVLKPSTNKKIVRYSVFTKKKTKKLFLEKYQYCPMNELNHID